MEKQRKYVEMITPKRVRKNLEKVYKILKSKKIEQNEAEETKIDFDPSELKGPMRELVFTLINGRKIHEFISLAWKRGIDIVNDPILGGIINCLQAANYQLLKKKGRILVEDSANLLGVIDSTGTLAPNEVYV